jgi:hypothetical protein
MYMRDTHKIASVCQKTCEIIILNFMLKTSFSENQVDVYIIHITVGDVDANVIHGLSFSQISCGVH